MKHCIAFLTVLALLLCMPLATMSAPSDPLSTEPPDSAYSSADLMGSWRIVRLTTEPVTPTPIVEYGTVEVASDGSTTISVQQPGGSVSTTNCTMAVLPDGQVVRDGNPWGVLSYDRTKILASGGGAGNWLALCTRPGSDASPEDMAGPWRMHSLSFTPTAQDWRILTGTADGAGNLSGDLISSSPGPTTYSATLDIEIDGGLQIVDDEGLTGGGQTTPDGLLFAHAAASVPPGTARFDVGVRLGGSFVTADLEGDWYFHGINTSGDQFYGEVACAEDGNFSGVSHNSSGSTDPIAGAFGITPNGSIGMTVGGVQMLGQGTLSLDRSFFAITWTEENGKTLMVATKHPTDVEASIDVTQVQMDWGNGFSFIEPMDQTWETLLCNQPSVGVNPANLQRPTPPVGAMATAGLVYSQEEDDHLPIYTAGKITLPCTLTASGSDICSEFMPELALYEWPWPARTGDIVLSATVDAPQGDLAPQVGNGVIGAEIGFSAHDQIGWAGDIWMSFGFATLYLTDSIGELEPGYYNRQPFINYGSEQDGSEDFSVAVADDYDPAYPVQLKIVITPSKLARYLAHFGPPEAEWTLCGERQLDWWPGAIAGARGCGTGAEYGLPWYSPYISSNLEYVDVSGEPEYGPMEIVTTELPDGTQGQAYDQTLIATGGSGMYAWEVVSGELPSGLQLMAMSGQLSGYAWDSGIYRFAVEVYDLFTDEVAEQDYTLVINRNLMDELQGDWGFHRIEISRDPTSNATSAFAYYGGCFFDNMGYCNVYGMDLNGGQITHSFQVIAQPDGTLLVDGEPWGVLSLDGKRIIAADYDESSGGILICTRLNSSDVFVPRDCEGSWRMHSFIAGGATPEWKAVEGEIDATGAFAGTETAGTGTPAPYTASVTIESSGDMQIVEPGNTEPQHSGMAGSRTLFGRLTGADSAAGFGIGVRTGASFTPADLQGRWRLKELSSTGDVSAGWIDADANGAFTGEMQGGDETPEAVSGTISIDSNGALGISLTDEGAIDGQGTLSLGRDFFVFTTTDGEHTSIILADKRPTEATSGVDVTRVRVDWGNGFTFDDPLDSDTEGTACDGEAAILVDQNVVTTPGLPYGGSVQPFYSSISEHDVTMPALLNGALSFSDALLPGFEEAECLAVVGVSTENIDWPAQNQNVEISAVFENLQGHIATGSGDSTVDCVVGFHVMQGDTEMGDIEMVFGLLTGYFHRGISGIPSGIYDGTPYTGLFVDAEEYGESMSLGLPIGYDPAQPVELKLLISPSGRALSYLRFGTGEWIPFGDLQADFWPGSNGYGAGCHSPVLPGVPITFVPYVLHRVEEIELPTPSIRPDWLKYGIIDQPYEVQFYSEDGLPPVQWSVSSGALPPGLDLDSDGLLSGTPSEAGLFQFTVRVEDGQAPSAVAERSFDLQILQPVSIQEAKARQDGSMVAVSEAIVTRRVDDGYYIQSPDRSGGIKLRYSGFLAEGWTVSFVGRIHTEWYAERVLEGECEILGTDINLPRPIGMPMRSLGGGGFRLDPSHPDAGQAGVLGGAGLNNIGLLVKTWGKVTQIDPYANYFYVDDGSGIKDGTYTGMEENTGVRVQQPPLDLQAGDYVTVSGISTSTSFDYMKLQRILEACEFEVHFPAAPPLILGTPDEAEGSCQIIFARVLGAEDYRLYESVDGRNYTLSTAIAEEDGDYVIFRVSPTGNTHYKVAAIGSGGSEGRLSRDVFARVADSRMNYELYSPQRDSTGVSLDPFICTPSIGGAVRMGMEIHSAFSGETLWGVIAYPWGQCVGYGYRGQFATYVKAAAPLDPETDYWVYTYAIDHGNWSFGDSGECPFRTSPAYDGDGSGNPPPHPQF